MENLGTVIFPGYLKVKITQARHLNMKLNNYNIYYMWSVQKETELSF
jgi:hypothetical protein